MQESICQLAGANDLTQRANILVSALRFDVLHKGIPRSSFFLLHWLVMYQTWHKVGKLVAVEVIVQIVLQRRGKWWHQMMAAKFKWAVRVMPMQ
jgi:hypothetical protein